MNRKERRSNRSIDRHKSVIHIYGKSYELGAAGALATKEHEAGNLPGAVEIYRLIIEKFPAVAEVYNNLGITLQDMRDYKAALEAYDKAAALKPTLAEVWNNRGITLQDMGRFQDALESCDKAIALKPDYVTVYCNRGIALQALRRSEDALASYDKAIALTPDYAEAYNNRSVTLQKIKLYDRALADCRQAIALKPGYADAYNNLGIVLVNKGNMQEAEKAFRKAMTLRPAFADAAFNLSNMRKYKDADDPDRRAIQAMLTQPRLSGAEKEQLLFALGKILDDCGSYQEAFQCYHLANRIRNSAVAYNPKRMEDIVTGIIEVFDRDFLAQSFGSEDRSPILVVGMPRSGTTLLASALSNHHAVSTAGELTIVTELTLRMKGMTGGDMGYPEAARRITPALAAGMVEEYRDTLRRDTGPEPVYVIDKHPLNFMHLGFMAKLFPKAHVVHCIRHPLDTGLSNYFQRFAPNYDYSFDLKNIGHFYGQYRKLMEYWHKVLPIPILDVRYEEMVGDTEPLMRKALDWLALDWDARCLSPHTNTHAVETASQWQVRQPIYTQSMQRWQHYEAQLAPLKEILERDGYLPY
jgi:tetratricopeptide (TPR) repeat protein